MKLLLTSGGLTNKSIASALFELVGKKLEDTTLCFIPTAATIEVGDKGWFIDDLKNIQKQNFRQVDIADISALPENIWKQKLEETDVIYFNGGITSYLMNWVAKSGLQNILPELLMSKVYVGSSAGSVITNKNLQLKISQLIYSEDLDQTEEIPGLNYVDFYFLPHLNSPHFPKMNEDDLRKVTEGMKEKMYAMDDDGALKIIDGKIEIISEGKYLEFN